jgi:DNA polymerase-3 subunit delta'
MTMTNILISKKNNSEINRFINRASHALVLVAPYGHGKKTMAKYIASELLKVDSLDNYPYFFVVSPENNLINIDKIREIKKVFQLKTTGKENIRRVVILENADLMNEESQNAILKILEEPPKDSVIILTVSNETKLSYLSQN